MYITWTLNLTLHLQSILRYIYSNHLMLLFKKYFIIFFSVNKVAFMQNLFGF